VAFTINMFGRVSGRDNPKDLLAAYEQFRPVDFTGHLFALRVDRDILPHINPRR
jgi:hypothetical protein